MFKQFLSIGLMLVLVFASIPASAQLSGSDSLSGDATDSLGRALDGTTIQLRNLATGQLAGTTISDGNGGFTFGGLYAGNFAIEIVNRAGQIAGTSASITVLAGAGVDRILVTASAAAMGKSVGSDDASPHESSISGSVTVSGNSPVPKGTTVNLQDALLDERVSSTQTNDLGEFTFKHLPAGVYVIAVADYEIGYGESEEIFLLDAIRISGVSIHLKEK